MMRTNEVPYWEKYMLTLREAAEYFHIGEKKMRQIVDDNLDTNFLLESGNRIMTNGSCSKNTWTERP